MVIRNIVKDIQTRIFIRKNKKNKVFLGVRFYFG
ncbi:hypothetical protein BPO_0302 [Bergeyella porcorum]|uniref:Uncharacterized protein n=1 Tax=Bergeyella porcorum TaxID=1735111 RepID=A0AAU0EZX0_9FLAO